MMKPSDVDLIDTIDVGPGLTVLDNGSVRTSVLGVLSLIAEYDAILGTRHLSAGET